jgi:VNT family MFS transporter (synaptic vesicle glycoprotein 2)
VGTGRFHHLALAICGLANAADAVEIMGMSLVLPAAEKDLALDAHARGALGSCIFLGMLLGGTWGLLGDRIGAPWAGRLLCFASGVERVCAV